MLGSGPDLHGQTKCSRRVIIVGRYRWLAYQQMEVNIWRLLDQVGYDQDSIYREGPPVPTPGQETREAMRASETT